MAGSVISNGVVDYPTGSESTTFTLTMPGGATNGDIIVLTPQSATNGLTLTATPSGSTQLAAYSANPSANHVDGGVYAYPVGATPPGSISFTWSGAARGNLNWVLVRGGDVTGLAARFAIGSWGATTSAVAPAVTALADSLVIGGVSAGSGSHTVTPAGAWSTLNLGAQRRGYLASKGVQSGAGTTGTATFTMSSGGSGNRAWQLAIPAAAGGGDPTPTVSNVILGAPTSTGFSVFAKVADATTARLKVGSNTAVTTDVVYSSSDTPDGDGYVALSITGLPARARDYYMIEATGAGGTITTSLLGSPLRVPAADTASSFTVGFGSCWDPDTAVGTPSFTRILARDPALFFHLGDFHYENNESTSQAVQRADLEAPIAADSGLRSLLASVPTVYVKSDHDGDANEQGPGVWTAPNRAATLQMFPYLTRPNSNGLYHAFTVGRVRFIMIDTRFLGDNSTTRLGSTQKAWLLDELERDEPLKVLVQDNAWISNEAAGTPGEEDDWPTYNTERQEIADHWETNGVGTLITIHGDQHALSADDGSHNPWGGFASFCAAPFRNTSSMKTLSQSDWSHGFWPTTDGTNVAQYGTVTFTDTGSYLTAEFNGYDTSDVVRVSLTVGTDGYVPPVAVTGASGSSLTAPTTRWSKAPGEPVWWDTVNAEWRGILPTSTGHRLYTLDPEGDTQGAVVDSRQAARVTTVHNAGTTYVLRQHASSSLLSVFNSSWSATLTDVSVPLTPADNDASPVSFIRTSNGYLWAAAHYTGSVRVTRSTDGGATWATPTTFTLGGGAITGVPVLLETGSTVVLFDTANDGVGRLVRTIPEGSASIASGSWTTESAGSLASPSTSDDHASGVTLPDGRILVVAKTTDPSSSNPLLYGTVRSTSGTWTTHTIELGPDEGARYTRPKVTLLGSTVHLVYGSIESPQNLSTRTMALDAVGTWSERAVLIPGPNWADSGVMPGQGDLAVSDAESWPVLAHNRTTGAVWITWQPMTATPGTIPGYVGSVSVEAMYVGSAPLEAVYLGTLQLV